VLSTRSSSTFTTAAAVHKLNSDALNPDFEVARLRFGAFEYAQAEEMCATSQFPDLVYHDILIDDDRQHVDVCISATAVEQGTSVPTFLIDPASLDVVPKPVFCKSPTEIPKDSTNGKYLNPRN
jgi:hypothetical protein